MTAESRITSERLSSSVVTAARDYYLKHPDGVLLLKGTQIRPATDVERQAALIPETLPTGKAMLAFIVVRTPKSKADRVQDGVFLNVGAVFPLVPMEFNLIKVPDYGGQSLEDLLEMGLNRLYSYLCVDDDLTQNLYEGGHATSTHPAFIIRPKRITLGNFSFRTILSINQINELKGMLRDIDAGKYFILVTDPSSQTGYAPLRSFTRIEISLTRSQVMERWRQAKLAKNTADIEKFRVLSLMKAE